MKPTLSPLLRTMAPAIAVLPDPPAPRDAPTDLATRQQAFLAMADGYQPGAILESSWGYEQTNIDFYRIVKRTPKFITLEPLRGTSTGETPGNSMTGCKIPLDEAKDPAADHDVAWPHRGCPPTFRRKLAMHRADGNPSGVSISHGWASLWNGKPAAYSWYA